MYHVLIKHVKQKTITTDGRLEHLHQIAESDCSSVVHLEQDNNLDSRPLADIMAGDGFPEEDYVVLYTRYPLLVVTIWAAPSPFGTRSVS